MKYIIKSADKLCWLAAIYTLRLYNFLSVNTSKWFGDKTSDLVSLSDSSRDTFIVIFVGQSLDLTCSMEMEDGSDGGSYLLLIVNLEKRISFTVLKEEHLWCSISN